MTVKFYQLAIGARFVFRGKCYTKTAISMTQDERGWGTIFLGETDVVSDGPLLPPEEAARQKPERGHWAAVIESMVTASPSDERSPSDAAPSQG